MKFKTDVRKALDWSVDKLMYSVTKLSGKEHAELLLEMVCRAYEKYNDEFAQYDLYPKESSQTYQLPLSDININKFAVVIQGPLDIEDNFTLETVRFYKKWYPDLTVIISTWEDENKSYLSKMKKEGAKIVLSKYPDLCGRGNMNYQCVSSLAGIKKAEKLGAEYCLRLRSDMRMYRKNILEYFYSLLHMFPINLNKEESYVPKGRIIADGFLFDPYWIQDFYYFGFTEDLIQFFSMKLDTSNLCKVPKDLLEINRIDLLEKYAPALYFTKSYLLKIYPNAVLENNVEIYWKMVKSYFICVGWEELEFYWHKYKDRRNKKNLIHCTYMKNDSSKYPRTYKWRFSNWLNLYCNRYPHKSDWEKYKHNKWE